MRARLRILAVLIPLVASADDSRIEVARFSEGRLDAWQTEVFSGETRYRLVEIQGRRVLRADSDGTASGLYREVDVSLEETPMLHWSWKVGNVLEGADERTRAGDDYPARVYVVFSGGIWFWRTRAINYVWSGHQPIDSAWPNAFTDNAQMIAVDSGGQQAGEWVAHSRDVRADYRRLFDGEPEGVDAVAIMTDTDNTGGAATAWYGDIWFSAP